MKKPIIQNSILSNRTQFDYPNSQVVQGYKKYIPDIENPHIQSSQQKQKYKNFIKQTHQKERNKVRNNSKMQQQKQRQQRQKQLVAEYQAKMKQLQQLQNIKKQALQQQKRAEQLAIIKAQQDKIKLIQEQQKYKQNKSTANFRFGQALKRLQQENKQRDFKKNQAYHRRKIHEQTQKAQRQKAIAYSAYIEQKQRNQKSKEKRQFDQFKQNLGRTAFAFSNSYQKNKTKDYSKSYSHNPKLLVAYKNLQSQQNQAMIQAEIISQKRRQSLQNKQRQSFQKNRKSLSRGKNAIIKMQRQKQYEQYCKQSEQKSFQYNMSRIQSAKKNQYIGIKPATLQQMQSNKKIRSQQQFQNTFMNNAKNNPEWMGNKRDMFKWRQENINNSKINDEQNQSNRLIFKKYNVPIDRINQDTQGNSGRITIYQNSTIPHNSSFKYDFTEPNIIQGIDGLTSVKKYQQEIKQKKQRSYKIPKHEVQEELDQDYEFPRNIPQPKNIQSMNKPIVYDQKDLGQTVSGTKQMNLSNAYITSPEMNKKLSQQTFGKPNNNSNNHQKRKIIYNNMNIQDNKKKNNMNMATNQDLQYSQSQDDGSYSY